MSILNEIKFDEKGLVPAIAQDYKTGEVLMMAYMDREAVEKTISSGKAHYFSRSRSKLWLKGETSGHFQHIKGIYYDCDVDTILLKVEQVGAACHTGERSCFYREIETPFSSGCRVFDTRRTDENFYYQPHPPTPHSRREGGDFHGKKEIATSSILDSVYKVILDRKKNPGERSYVSSLFSKGTDSILKKVGEEASELLISGKGGKREEVVYEMADLWFHSLVLLGQMDIAPEEVYGELQRRFGRSGIEEKEGRSKKEGN